MRIVNKSHLYNVIPNPSWSTPAKILTGAAALAVAMFLSKKGAEAYERHRNSNIKEINCRFGEASSKGGIRNFDFYKKAAESGDVKAQYCLAEMYKSGNGTPPSLSEARKWYKKAAEQDLIIAKDALCRKSMFENQTSDGDGKFKITLKKYIDFASICCSPTRSCLTNLCAPPLCPWQKEYHIE